LDILDTAGQEEYMNYHHMMPTRYGIDLDLKGVVSSASLDKGQKKTVLTTLLNLDFGLKFPLLQGRCLRVLPVSA
jgi:hypothetical protein